ncbi:MAG: hypothetical protein Q4F80_03520, partial [bacterium]|nr:hypothetical protein [bacterium]
LKSMLESVQDEQGIIGKAWDGIKNFFGIGLSSNDAKEAIESYQNGEITLEQAQNTIETFSQKQEGASNLFANIATGLIVAGSVVATGGLSLGVIATGAAVGGAAKAGIKTLDRATNNIEGDALDAKQIAKDALTGAIDGAVTTATAGMAKSVTVAGQTVKEAAKQGAIQGAKAGVISGAVTGAGNYTVEAAFEDDVDFTLDGLIDSTVQNAVAGGITGGIAGGLSSGIAQSKLNNATPQTTELAVIEPENTELKAVEPENIKTSTQKNELSTEVKTYDTPDSTIDGTLLETKAKDTPIIDGAETASGKQTQASQTSKTSSEASSKTSANESAKSAASGAAKTKTTADYSSIESQMKTRQKGYWTQTEIQQDTLDAIGKGVQLENNAELTQAYNKLISNTNSSTIKQFKHTIGKLFHPDSGSVGEESFKFYYGLAQNLKATAA